jgi:hypothetical protein
LRLEEDGFYHEGRLSEDNSILCGNFTLIKSRENTHIVIWEEDDFDTSTTITSKEIENLDSMHVFNHGKRGLKYPTKSILRLKKKDFTTDTKVDMDQLRAYLDAKLLYS